MLHRLLTAVKKLFRMKRSIRLFIGDSEVEFASVPDVLYTFKVDELTEPAVSRNTFSKTISIPGTPKNNRIFGQYWASDRTTSNNFDATRKTPFTLYVDNEVYQTGYCKLNEIVQNKNSVTYSVSLFGGLGTFFANLTYKNDEAGDDEKKKLSDLDFYAGEDSDTPIELDFVINKETIEDAWENIDGYSSKWHVINFAPAYNGLPDDFDSNKVLMNIGNSVSSDTGGRVARRPGGRGSVITTAVTEDGITYTTYAGYALAELSREYTEPEMREFRSYLQRPVLNVQRTIEAICRPENNGGWEVELDPDWFKYDNCYYSDLWVTLPMLSSLDYNASVIDTGVTISLGASHTGTTAYSANSKDPTYYLDRLAQISADDSGFSCDIQVKLTLSIDGVNDTTNDRLVLCAKGDTSTNPPKWNYAQGVMVQLVAYDGGGNPVAGSQECYITSAFGSRRVSENGRTQVRPYFIERDNWLYTPAYGDEFFSSKGNYFVKNSGSRYDWDEEIVLTAKNVPAGSTLKVLVTEVYKNANYPSSNRVVFYRDESTQVTGYALRTFQNFILTLNSSRVSFKTNEGIRTGAGFTKKQLLDTDYTPAEFLLSYAKIFGLYFVADPVRQKVSILSRKNFFRRDEIVDIDRYIDRENYKITPLVFDSKWYKWNLEADESEYGKAYEDTYGKSYGEQLVNTNYNFNSETKDVLDDNVFKGAVQVLERSDAFCYTGQDTTSKPWMFPGYKYLLYNENDSTETTEVEVNASSTIDAFSGFTTGYLYYDLFDKVQLHSADNNPADGTNVLLIRSGNKDLSVGSVSLNYYITDDNSVMNILNQSRPCWLYTNSETDVNGNSIATKINYAPYFSRYKIYDASGYITRSMDFGKPEEIYIPNAIYRPGSTIYEEFWKTYVRDLYNKDTRVVKTKMYFREKPSVDWLRRFYWFDNTLYRMVSINDYNVAKNGLTEVEFVKVNDKENYTSVSVSEDVVLSVTLSSNQVSYSGGSVQYSISISDGGRWYIDYYDSATSVSATAGTGDYTGTWTIPASTSSSDIQRSMIVMADNVSVRVYLTQTGVRLGISGPMETGDVYWTGGTRTYTLISPDSNWSAKTSYSGIITSITPSEGTPTDESGVTISVEVGQNDDGSTREANIYAEIPGGTIVRGGYLRQGVAPAMSISVTPSLVDDVPSSGGTIQLTLNCTEGWRGYRNQNWVSISPASGSSGTTIIDVTIEPNQSDDSRYVNLSFYRENSPASNPANCIITQVASDNYISVVPSSTNDYSQTGGTINLSVTSTQPWTGSTEGNGLTISPSTGASGVTQVVATIGANEGDERTMYARFYRSGSPSSNPAVYTITQNGQQREYEKEYLTLEIVSGGTIVLTGSGSYDAPLPYYSFDSGETWTRMTSSAQTLNVSAGDKIQLKNNNTYYEVGSVSSASTASFDAYGNLMSMMYGGNFENLPSALTGNFMYFFKGTKIRSAKNLILPCKTLSQNYCYMGMFEGSTLTDAPSLPATTLSTECYLQMFRGCTNLTKAPELQATSLANKCYEQMFSGCTSLTTAPVLPATALNASYCYRRMFGGCTSLTSITCLATSAFSDTTNNWLLNASPTGTFYKPSGATFWSRDVSGIPTGWSIVDV